MHPHQIWLSFAAVKGQVSLLGTYQPLPTVAFISFTFFIISIICIIFIFFIIFIGESHGNLLGLYQLIPDAGEGGPVWQRHDGGSQQYYLYR